MNTTLSSDWKLEDEVMESDLPFLKDLSKHENPDSSCHINETSIPDGKNDENFLRDISLPWIQDSTNPKGKTIKDSNDSQNKDSKKSQKKDSNDSQSKDSKDFNTSKNKDSKDFNTSKNKDSQKSLKKDSKDSQNKDSKDSENIDKNKSTTVHFRGQFDTQLQLELLVGILDQECLCDPSLEKPTVRRSKNILDGWYILRLNGDTLKFEFFAKSQKKNGSKWRDLLKLLGRTLTEISIVQPFPSEVSIFVKRYYQDRFKAYQSLIDELFTLRSAAPTDFFIEQGICFREYTPDLLEYFTNFHQETMDIFMLLRKKRASKQAVPS
jgi:hypothetical protein